MGTTQGLISSGLYTFEEENRGLCPENITQRRVSSHRHNMDGLCRHRVTGEPRGGVGDGVCVSRSKDTHLQF